MAILSKVAVGDFDRVYGLFESLEGTPLSKDIWHKIFAERWRANEGYCGYMLVEGDDVVGFLGMIFSRRKVAGELIKVCNISTWVVQEKYRNESLKLLIPIMKMKDYMLTVLTANTTVSYIFGKLGFKLLDSYWILIPPLPVFSTMSAALKYRFVFGLHELEQSLSGEDLRIFQDHKNLDCRHLLIFGDNQQCYIVYHRIWRKGLPLVSIDYISDPAVFTATLGYLQILLPTKLRALGTVVDARFLRGYRYSLAIRRAMPIPSPRLYKTSLNISPEQVDNLYSELLLLGI